jgi:hypothetical protein
VRNKIYMIVEGPGELSAVPILLRRILHENFQRYELTLAKPFLAKGKGNLTISGGLERYLENARAEADCGAMLILVDADKEDVACPPRLAKDFAERSRKPGLPFPIAIVVAVCEYESWFLANLETIAPKYFEKPETITYEGNPEAECSAKGWLARQMPNDFPYSPSIHQDKMSQLIDLDKTYVICRSFKRLVDAVEELLQAIDEGKTTVSPAP